MVPWDTVYNHGHPRSRGEEIHDGAIVSYRPERERREPRSRRSRSTSTITKKSRNADASTSFSVSLAVRSFRIARLIPQIVSLKGENVYLKRDAPM